MGFWCLLPLQAVAVACDLYARKIPNALIMGGLILGGAYQWSTNGPPGLAEFAGGVLLPVLLLGVLHYFRMLGAGDVKLLMMSGGFLGADGSLHCIFLTFLTAGVISFAIILRKRILWRRLHYFAQYVASYQRRKEWIPYIDSQEKDAYLHFSIPIFVGSLLMMGGIF